MTSLPDPMRQHISTWPQNAQAFLSKCQTIFHQIAQDRALGPLDEALKWGQPAWRPMKPRTGSTLRVDWAAATPDHLSLFVDCKTDLAARMATLYPDLPMNDGRRHLAIDVTQTFPEQAVSHLAEMTFCYHLAKRKTAAAKA